MEQAPRNLIQIFVRAVKDVHRLMTEVNLKYRVSIKSFPNYRHLLQENYVEYKYIYIFFKM